MRSVPSRGHTVAIIVVWRLNLPRMQDVAVWRRSMLVARTYAARRTSRQEGQQRMGTPRIHFAGSGDAFGIGGRFQTCIALENGETLALIDCGATSLVALKRL